MAREYYHFDNYCQQTQHFFFAIVTDHLTQRKLYTNNKHILWFILVAFIKKYTGAIVQKFR